MESSSVLPLFSVFLRTGKIESRSAKQFPFEQGLLSGRKIFKRLPVFSYTYVIAVNPYCTVNIAGVVACLCLPVLQAPSASIVPSITSPPPLLLKPFDQPSTEGELRDRRLDSGTAEREREPLARLAGSVLVLCHN